MSNAYLCDGVEADIKMSEFGELQQDGEVDDAYVAGVKLL